MLFLVKALHALLDWPRTGFDVEGVLDDFPGDSWHFCHAPHKHVLIVSEELNERAFLFGIQTGPDMHGFSGSPASICMALASLSILKMPDFVGMDGLSSAIGIRRLSSLSSAAATATMACSMLSYSQSSTRCVLASMVMTLAGLGILSFR
jgi:hypothetical protein